AGAIKNVKAGSVSDPLRTDEGYQILRVDSRTAGGSGAVFVENNVRGAMAEERSPKAREDYMQGLRNEGYIKIAESYSDAVKPFLKLVPPAAATKRPAKKDKDKKDKGNNASKP